MALVTLRVLDGADRGKTFKDVPTPLTIGREEGNAVQLNDERISRFHIKIQEDQEKTVLTDLQSTNGTKVNGEPIQIWSLRYGDVFSLGRTVLIFGSRDQIAQRLANLRGVDLSEGAPMDDEEVDQTTSSVSLEEEFHFGDDPEAQATLHTLLPPELPVDLTPGQAAQTSELIQYLHLRMRSLVSTVHVDTESEQVVLKQRQWQNLLDLHDRLAKYLKAIGEPD